MKKICLLLACVLALGLTGCKNTLYFYSTEKIAINVEGRPDPSAPVSGTIGARQRIALVTPPKKVDENGVPADDALSIISYFNFTKQPKASPNEPGVTIESVLITGEAVVQLKADGTELEAFQAAGTAFAEIPTWSQMAESAVQNAVKDENIDRLRDLVSIPWKDLTPAQKHELGGITYAGALYGEQLHNEIRMKLEFD